MLPFIAIEDREYSTYLAGAINFSSGCPVMSCFKTNPRFLQIVHDLNF